MKMRSVVAAANIGFMCLLMVGIAAEAAELKVLSATGMQAVMEDLGPKFERATGHKLAISFVRSRSYTRPGFEVTLISTRARVRLSCATYSWWRACSHDARPLRAVESRLMLLKRSRAGDLRSRSRGKAGPR